jgi:hypothetical protein
MNYGKNNPSLVRVWSCQNGLKPVSVAFLPTLESWL